ncbi:unnamed protein product [Ilex paraguariensis]|uniref:Uncharacterized protein n=1 Tax=Ilex paraguariensis TaxID=185542 RepID=A0ABC8THG8_9AQUA
MPQTATRGCQEQEDQLELLTGELQNPAELPENPIGVPKDLLGRKQNTLSELESKASRRIEKGLENPCVGCPSNKQKVDIASMFDPLMNSREFEAPREVEKILVNNIGMDDSKELPAIKLSLKRLRGVKDGSNTVQDDRNVLRRSELSAFSRYTTTSNAFKAPNAGSSSLLDNSLEVIKKESVCNTRAHSDGNILYPSSNGVSNIIDMASTTNKLSTNVLILKDKSEATSTIHGLHLSSVFKPLKNDLRCTSQQVLAKADDVVTPPALAPPSHQEVPIQHIHHHHHHHHFHDMEQVETPSNHDGPLLKKSAADVPQCGSSNVLSGPVEGNPGNFSLNRSASGSNLGSNGLKEGNTAINAGGTKAESETGLAGKSRSVDASGSGSGNRMDQTKYVLREAALNKFRQKRKEQCFRKYDTRIGRN